MSEISLRAALAAASPGPRIARAWPLLLSGRSPASPVRSRGALDRLLDRPPLPGKEAQILELAQALGQLIEGGGGEADPLLERLAALVARTRLDPVLVEVEGWPEQMDAPTRSVLWPGPARCSPHAAALLVRRLDGLVLGGARLSVKVGLAPGEQLPAAPWEARRGRRPWLAALDGEGRLGLTPEPIARAQARAITTPEVIEGYGGCGGNTVAFVEAGLRVIAVERDRGRQELARQNLARRGLLGQVELIVGEVEQLLPRLQAAHPQAAVFLDPPWGGADWDRAGMGWGALLPNAPDFLAALFRAPQRILKLPRAFDLATLPAAGAPWRVEFELGDADRGDGDVVKMLTVLSMGPTGRSTD